MKINTTTPELMKLVKKLENHTIVLPKFQRDFTWGEQKQTSLLDSIVNKHPIGAITLYKNGKKSLIVDGQQRLTSIYKMHKEKKFSEDFNYLIPVLEWVNEDNEDDPIAKFFVDMNDNSSPLDKEDITLTMLSEVKFDKPSWFTGTQEKLIKKMYHNRNPEIKVLDTSPNEISLLEAMWIILSAIESFDKNHDKNIMAYLSHKPKEEKVKYKLVWMKRILVLLFETDINKMNYHNNEKEFGEKLTKICKSILSDEHSHAQFTEKIHSTFITLQEKFNFILKIPSNSSGKTREVINKILAKDYIPIYILSFVFQNRELYKEEFLLQNITQKIESYVVKGVDIINFMSKKPISAGGYYKWLNYIVEQPDKLFYTNSESTLNVLVDSIMEQTINNKDSFNKMTKVVALWLADGNFKYEIGNKEMFYEFDHIIPKKYCDSLGVVETSSLANCDILTSDENQDKNSQLTFDYLYKSLINKKYKYQYTPFEELSKNFQENKNTINKNDFHLFINHRKDFLKEKIKEQISKEAPM